jgi:uncharacterized membrane protein YgcG
MHFVLTHSRFVRCAQVNDALAGGMDWPSLTRLIKDERRAGNPVASLIASLDLPGGAITVILSNVDDAEAACAGEECDAAQTRPASLVRLNLSLSAYGNAREYHVTRKKHSAKAAKTRDAAQATLAAAEKRAAAQVASLRAAGAASAAAAAAVLAGSGPGAAVVRRPAWYEKFTWFVTSENALVLTGRDPQQTALLLARHLRPGDALVCADVAGAPPHVVKRPAECCGGVDGNDGDVGAAAPPPLSLQQAGDACVCRSSAWEGKFATSAWWAPASAVQATSAAMMTQQNAPPPLPGAPAFCVPLSARVQLAPSHLVMGVGILFRVADEDAAAAHAGERAVRGGAAGAVASADSAAAAAAAAAAAEAAQDAADAAEAAAAGGDDDDDKSDDDDADEAENADEAAAAVGALRIGAAEDDAAAGSGGEEEEEEDASDADADAAGAGVSELDAFMDGTRRAGILAPPRTFGLDAPPPPHARGSANASNAKPKAAPQAPPAAAASVRGKSKKLKKMKEKYGDQDEEDRALAMALLAPAGKSRKAVEAEAAAARKAAAAEETRRRAETRAANAGGRGGRDGRGGRGGAGGRGGGGRGGRGDAESGSGAAPVSAAAAAADAEDAAVAALPDTPASARARLAELSLLTGAPRPGEPLLWALAVVAPHSALIGYKLRLKLTPGAARKGRAAKAALDALRRVADVAPGERELLRAMSDADAAAAMVNGAKVYTAALGKLLPAAAAPKRDGNKKETGGGKKGDGKK